MERLSLIGAGAAVGIPATVLIRVTRHRRALAVEHMYASTRHKNADGVVLGALGFTLRGTNGRALLLLHGSGDTPQSLRYLAERLHLAGYTVHAPLLPGHGRSPRAFGATGADEYLSAARAGLQTARASASWVAVIGLSMGAALAAELASEAADIQVLVLLAPYLIATREVRLGILTAWLWNPFVAYVNGGGNSSVHDESARAASHAYGTFSAGALRALNDTANIGWRALPRLAVSTLVVNSEQDNRISRENAKRILDAIPAPLEQHWVTGCGHVITVDFCKDEVANLILTFLARHAD